MALGKKKKGKKEAFEPQDLYSCVEQLPFKRLMQNQQKYIELKEQGYLELMEINGKDIYSMGEAEAQRTLLNFYDWLTKFTPDFEIYTTTLPTKTDDQINYLKDCLAECRKQLKQCRKERLYHQLLDRESILLNSIQTEELIRKQIYNTEFIMLLFAPTIKELDEVVRKAKSYGNGEFVPTEITEQKKEQILKQYYNMNEKL